MRCWVGLGLPPYMVDFIPLGVRCRPVCWVLWYLRRQIPQYSTMLSSRVVQRQKASQFRFAAQDGNKKLCGFVGEVVGCMQRHLAAGGEEDREFTRTEL